MVMLLFSEGVPGSGKSYDAVRDHILPALRKGRKVFARINGLKHDAIASYLGMPLEDVEALLTHVSAQDVLSTFVASQNHDGEWRVSDDLHNALIVIDEVHEFYVGGTREAMPVEREQFFALHRHFGLDVLVMTQFYKRVHVMLRSRIERKNAFQKLSALGKKGEALYLVTFFQTVAPDKYEKLGSETRKYDSAIFPLYAGIASAGAQTEVYKQGRTSVWAAMKWRALFIIPLGGLAIYFLVHFFVSGGAGLVKRKPIAGSPAPMVSTLPSASVAVAPGQPVTAKVPVVDKLSKMTPEQRYIWELSGKARARLAALVGVGPDPKALIEWVDPSGVVQERLSSAQIRDLGIVVQVHKYGVRLQAQGQAILATAWPLTLPERDVRPQLYNTSGEAQRATGEQREPLAAATGRDAQSPGGSLDAGHAFYGGMRGEVGSHPPPEGL